MAGTATHVRFVVLTNQCTGAPDYQGDQDDDPINVITPIHRTNDFRQVLDDNPCLNEST